MKTTVYPDRLGTRTKRNVESQTVFPSALCAVLRPREWPQRRTGEERTARGEETSSFLRHSTLKTEDLPRQARDKHRKSWKQDTLPQVESEYLPVFAAGVAAGAQGVMPSYNSIDGVPVAADKWLLTDMLRTGAKRPLHILLVLSSSSSFTKTGCRQNTIEVVF